MSVIPFILAAGSLPTLIFGAPVPSIHSRDVAGAASVQSFSKRESASSYTVFGGDGDVSDGWPSMDDWVSTFDEMFEANQEVMSSSCSQWDVSNNSDDENDAISSAIQSVANSTGVDARFILAIVMQESNGCVRVPTTDNGVVNPGLMQSHDGTGTCNDDGDVQDPCPSSEITQMITDGTSGTSAGDGLQQLISETGVDDVTKYYLAARMYNSGSVASDGNLGQGDATHCYASDIANRLIGWSTGTGSCDSDTIGDLTGTTATLTAAATSTAASATTAITSVSSVTQPATTSVSVPTVTPVTTSTTPSVPAATTASSTPAAATPTSSSSSSDPIYPGATSSCTKYFSVVSGDYCLQVEADVGITASQLIDWNSGLDESCSNLWLGYQYCIQA